MFKSRLKSMMGLLGYRSQVRNLRTTPAYMQHCRGDRRSVANQGTTYNKYKPHQGVQECARRVRQGVAAWQRPCMHDFA